MERQEHRLRDAVVKLIEILRSVPLWQRTKAMDTMLGQLERAVEEYDRAKVGK